jgi:hypothetical protein
MGLTLPVRAGFTSVAGSGGRGHTTTCALVFLVPDLDILPGTEVAQYLNQQADGQTCFRRDPVLLPVLLGVVLAGVRP